MHGAGAEATRESGVRVDAGRAQLGGADSLPRLTRAVPQFPRQCSGHDDAAVPGGRRDLISGCKMSGIWLLPGTPQPAPLLVAKGTEPLSPARLGVSAVLAGPPPSCVVWPPTPAPQAAPTERAMGPRPPSGDTGPAARPFPAARASAPGKLRTDPPGQPRPRPQSTRGKRSLGPPRATRAPFRALPRLHSPAQPRRGFQNLPCGPALLTPHPPRGLILTAGLWRGLGSVRSRLRSETLAPPYRENGSILLVLPARSGSSLGVPRLSSVLSSFARLASAEQGRAYVRSSPHNSPGRKCHPHPFHCLLYMVPLCAALWVVGLAPSPP